MNYPEEIPFEEQLAFFADALVVAGSSGSALHNSLFMRPCAMLIELADSRYGGERTPTQLLCDLVSSVETVLIPFFGTLHDDGNSKSLDIMDLRDKLIEILDDSKMPAFDLENLHAGMRSSEKIETLYVSYRPLIGTRLRKLFEPGGNP